jgi:hypothetical protein
MRCEECYQRFAELEREVESQKAIIDALIGVADKVIADKNLCMSDGRAQKNEIVIHDAAEIRAAFEGDEI